MPKVSNVANTPAISVTVEFTLDGQNFTALNGGPIFKFTPAISLQVGCKDQAEVDHFYDKLGEGGDTSLPCGWLTVSRASKTPF